MASIPGICPHCGHVFDGAGGIRIIGGGNNSFSGNKMRCPKCGKMGNLVDGVFNDKGNGLEIVSAPPLTYAVVERLRQIAREAKQGKITPEVAVQQVEAVDPTLGRYFRTFHDLGIPYLSLFVAIVTLYLQWSDGLSQDEFQNRVIALAERQTIAAETAANLAKDRPQSVGSVQRIVSDVEGIATKDISIKEPSQRRKEVRKQRSRALKERREAFVPRPTKRPTR